MSKVWTAPLFVAAAIMGLLGFALLPGDTTVWAGLFQVGAAIVFLVAGLLSRRRGPTPAENKAIPWIAVGLLALVLVFGGRQANIALLELGVRGPSAIEERAKSEVAAQLRDPQSAVFTNVANDGSQVCGEVNGRNGFGAYAGAKRFVWQEGRPPEIEGASAATGFAQVDAMRSCFFERSWTRCKSLEAPAVDDCVRSPPEGR